MTRATVSAVAIVSPFSCGDVLRGYNGRNVKRPTTCSQQQTVGNEKQRMLPKPAGHPLF
jgi:hypothetical protein